MYKHILIPTDGSELSNKAIRHGVFHETACSSGRGACSPQRHRQCPILRQRQGATAAARRDEGVTLRPRLYGEGSA
jgi:hypothetical protein